MIIKLFKIDTKQLIIFSKKQALLDYVREETQRVLKGNYTIDYLISCLPRENYDRIK